MGESGGQNFFTEWEETYDSFEDMGLHKNLVRGIYAYGEPPSTTQIRFYTAQVSYITGHHDVLCVWREDQGLPFFTSSNITFTEKKNTLKARYGVLWNKKIAYRHRTGYIEGQGIARDTHCPFGKDADAIGHILGSCTHSEVKKVYISRHDKAVRLIMKEIQNGSLGNFFCTADVGTAVAMEELGAGSKRLPNWLVTQTQCRSVTSPLTTNKSFDQTA